MADFQPFNLAGVLHSAEVLRGMKRQGTLDDLQAQYLGGQITRAESGEQRAQAGESRAAAQETRAGTEFSQEQQITTTRLLNAAAAEVAENPAAARRWDPIIKSAIPDWQPIEGGDPAQIQAAAKELYKSTSAALQAFNRTGTAANVQSTFIGGNGNIWQTLRDGQTRDTGVQARPQNLQSTKISLPDGRSIDAQTDPTTGAVYGMDGGLLSPPIRGGAAGAPAQTGQPGQPAAAPSAPAGMGRSQSPADAARAKALGEATAKAEFDLPRLEQNASQSLATIKQLRDHPGLPYITGLYSKAPIVPGGDQAAADALAKQIGGKTFLEAYNTLRGGGQITEVEGEKAQDAIARLSRTQGTEDFQKALDELGDVIRTGLDRARKQGGGSSAAPAQPNPGRFQIQEVPL